MSEDASTLVEPSRSTTRLAAGRAGRWVAWSLWFASLIASVNGLQIAERIARQVLAERGDKSGMIEG